MTKENSKDQTIQVEKTTGYTSDKPLQPEEKDMYELSKFAGAVATKIRDAKDPKGTVVAVNAKWGAGKTSALNLIRDALEEQQDDEFTLEVLEFDCWHYAKLDTIISAFCNILNDALCIAQENMPYPIPAKKEEIENALKILEDVNFHGGINIGMLNCGLSSKKKWTKTIETTLDNINKFLEASNTRFIIIIDDIDRLTPKETLMIFRLLKTAGDLSNIIYLIALDIEKAEEIINVEYKINGKECLEKFLTNQEKLPTSDKKLLMEHFISLLNTTEEKDEKYQDFKRGYQDNRCPAAEDILTKYADTPRKIVRFASDLNLSNFQELCQEINAAELLILRVLKFFKNDQELYMALSLHKQAPSEDIKAGVSKFYHEKLHPSKNQSEIDKQFEDERERLRKKIFDHYMRKVNEEDKDKAAAPLQYLFPELENTRNKKNPVGNVKRPISDKKYYPIYFEEGLDLKPPKKYLGLVPAMDEVLDFIDSSDNQQKIKAKLQDLIAQSKDTKENKLNYFLGELSNYPERTTKVKALNILSVLLEETNLCLTHSNSEIIDLVVTLIWNFHPEPIPKNSSFPMSANDQMEGVKKVYDERKLMLVQVAKNTHFANLRLLTSDVLSALFPNNEQYLTKVGIKLTGQFLEKVRIAADNGQLIKHPDLKNLLYNWQFPPLKAGYDNEIEEIRKWAAIQMQDDDTACYLIRGLEEYAYKSVYEPKFKCGENALVKVEELAKRAKEILDKQQLSAEKLDWVKVFRDKYEDTYLTNRRE